MFRHMPRKRRIYKKKRKYKPRIRRSLNMNVYKFRMVLEAPLLTTDVSGRQGHIDAAINCNSLSLHFNTQPGGASPPYGLLEEKDLGNLFDQYRVQGIKITYTPHQNEWGFFVDENLPTVAAVNGNKHQPLYIAYDVDNAGVVPASELVTRKKTRVKALFKPWKTTFRLPKTYSPDQTSLFGGWRNLQQQQNNLTGIISMSTADPIEYYNDTTSKYTPIGLSQPIGRVMIETYVLFRKRQ